MEKKRTILFCLLLLVILTVTCSFLDLAWVYWKNYRMQEIYCKKIDNTVFQKTITLSPVCDFTGSFQAVLYTENDCFGIFYSDNQQKIFLRKSMWWLGGFSYIYFYYQINEPAVCSQIQRHIRELKNKTKPSCWTETPAELLRNLADKLRLNESNFDEWAALEKVDTCLENYCFVVAVQKAWYKSATENWDWERSDGDGKETAEYSCPGWSCSREILDKILNNRLTFHDIPLNARESLARKVELDEREIDKWGQELQGWIDGNGIRVTVRVPNVWITANILAFDPSFTGTLAALGGIVGSMGTSVSNIFSGMMEVKCGNLGELAFALNRFKGKIWGLSLFAHGSKDGLISDTPGVNNCTWQESLITAVQQNNYKLGRINLMQCFSGFFGKTTRIVKSTNPQETLASMRLRLEKYFKSFPYISVRKINTQYKTGGTKPASPDDPIIAEIEMTVLWAYVWSTLAVKLRKYQNQNICLLDI